ncbi:MAG: exo-alpha-sialidase, partial [Thermoplasmata archaeon]|nr:exo-alpha-sialidase [Thermoplasmata archaeon]
TQDLGTEPLPEPLPIESQEIPEPIEPKGWVDKDFIISFDDGKGAEEFADALNVSVAVTPPGIEFEGTIHAVWDEYSDLTKSKEIHYSSSKDNGASWSGEEKDIIISLKKKDSKASPANNSVMPSICVDELGYIHVIWAQLYNNTMTWEVHYIRSTNNGESWSAAKRISNFRGEGDATSILFPKLAVGTHFVQKSKADPAPLYACWPENHKGEYQEVYFSMSSDGGDVWTGAGKDIIISTPEGQPDQYFAHSPQIGAGGDYGKITHVTWKQEHRSKAVGDEICYRRRAANGEWQDIIPISKWDPEYPMKIETVSIASGHLDVHVVWNQINETSGDPPEIFYSGSPNLGVDWLQKEVMISDPDGMPAKAPTAATILKEAVKGKADPPATEVHVTWSEVDENSPEKTYEIHYSMSADPWDPKRWTGQENDIVLSWPDKNKDANAQNPSIAMRQDKETGNWDPQIVWEELNVFESKDKADSNTEIHYKPSLYPLDVSVSPGGAGWVTKNPDKLLYEEGEDVEITAHANSGYVFSDWSGDTTGSANPKTITMNSCMSITANYDHVDLVANSVTGPSSCNEGDNIGIFRSFSNNGNIASSYFWFGLYLSTDSVITTSDTLVYSGYVS